MAFTVHSPAFEKGGPIPPRHHREGQNLSPPLRWADPPAGTKSFVVVVEDPNRPHGVFHLWAVHGIGADETELAEGVGAEGGGVRHALNDLGKARYDGPKAPPDRGVYHYHFIIAALDVPELEVRDNATAGDIWDAATPHMIGRAEVAGLIERR